MKAWVLHGVNDLRFETVEEPALKEDEVLVAVKAAAICGSDIPRIYRTGAYSHPLIPGHEFSGIVEKAGADKWNRWLGKRVGVFPLVPCGTCVPCRKKQYEMCRNYSYLGSRRNGGFAEYAAVPAENLIELPDNVSYREAAMLEPMAVAVHAIRRMKPRAEERIAVCGLGTIGLLLLIFLMEAGCKDIFAIGNKDSQRKMAVRIGLKAENYCDCRITDAGRWITERTDGEGMDAFFECVGRNETLVQAVNGTAPAGRICLIGNPYSDMSLEKGVYWKILRNQLTVMGTWNSSFTHEAGDDWHYVLDRLGQKKIDPAELVSHVYPLEGLLPGLEIMRDKAQEYIKIMAEIG